ncbi:MAG TPA: hypothetical protein VII74_01735 [Chthoniobacterales bacterium]
MSILTRRRNSQPAAGFSLIEVVLALGVVAFALVAILGVFPAAFSQNRKGISDTRASQLVQMIVATIDSQATTFASVDCFGTNLDLANSSTGTAPVLLYADYASPSQPEITNTKNPNSIYTIEIRFNNNPDVAPSIKLPAGSVNQLQIRIRGLVANSTDFREFMYLARKKT